MWKNFSYLTLPVWYSAFSTHTSSLEKHFFISHILCEEKHLIISNILCEETQYLISHTSCGGPWPAHTPRFVQHTPISHSHHYIAKHTSLHVCVLLYRIKVYGTHKVNWHLLTGIGSGLSSVPLKILQSSSLWMANLTPNCHESKLVPSNRTPV